MPLFLSPKQLKKLFPFFSRRARRIVARDTSSHKEKEGWWLETGAEPVWHGYYRTKYGPGYKGKVETLNDPKFYIQFPAFPPQLERHKHKLCFRDQHNNGWHWVHLSPAPKDIDAGIFAIERTLNDALTRPLKKSA